MSDWIVVSGVPPYDGRYLVDVPDITSRELGWIKRLAGTLPADIEAGLRKGDAELYCALAVIALRRADKITAAEVDVAYDRFADAPYGALEIDVDDVEADQADPPTSPSSSVNGAGSGAATTTSSESQVNGPSRSGIPGSVGSGSDPAISAT